MFHSPGDALLEFFYFVGAVADEFVGCARGFDEQINLRGVLRWVYLDLAGDDFQRLGVVVGDGGLGFFVSRAFAGEVHGESPLL